MCIRFCPRGLVLTGASLCLVADVELNQSEPSCLTPPEPTRAIRRWSRAEPCPPEANAKRWFAPNCIAPKSPSHGPCSSPTRCKQFANSSLHFLRRKNLRLERRVSNAHTPYSRRPFKVWCYGRISTVPWSEFMLSRLMRSRSASAKRQTRLTWRASLHYFAFARKQRKPNCQS